MIAQQQTKLFRRDLYGIAALSLFVAGGIVISLAFLPHNKVVLSSIYRQLVLIVVAIVAGVLVWRETQPRNKVLFLLFVLLGIQQLFDIAYHIVPTVLFPENKFAGVLYYQYVTAGLGLFVQTVCLLGGAILMNTRFPVGNVIFGVCTLSAVALIAVLHPLLVNPKYLYSTPDITDFRIVDRAWVEIFGETKAPPRPEVVASRINLSRWDGERRIGELTMEEKVTRVIEMETYLYGNNYNMLVFKPLNQAWWQLNLFCALVLLVIILSWFIGAAPEAVYFDRLSIVLVCFSIFEVFHFHTYSNLKNYEDYLNYFNTGAFLSLLAVLGLILLLLQRLRFILSYEGQYYESRLLKSPKHITRWRDNVDNYIIRKFFGGNPYRNRFLTRLPPG